MASRRFGNFSFPLGMFYFCLKYFFPMGYLFPLGIPLFCWEFLFFRQDSSFRWEFLLTEANLTRCSSDTGAKLDPMSFGTRVQL